MRIWPLRQARQKDKETEDKETGPEGESAEAQHPSHRNRWRRSASEAEKEPQASQEVLTEREQYILADVREFIENSRSKNANPEFVAFGLKTRWTPPLARHWEQHFIRCRACSAWMPQGESNPCAHCGTPRREQPTPPPRQEENRQEEGK